ncbi:TRAP transporter small permease [Desertibacillus haloalkaliphilus]|uniref:TRAP transporter small permease n=1 Tax=Desertibacillus haloalkaliphilus TaxID=1328930 RepID=UPI001C2790E6|nr:TRAP transporter small permease [Desertibacillus haloalkaliphilus]MBU8908307.1 TRAP transporter small permease [Desertibacillus haloalkaliphilus]
MIMKWFNAIDDVIATVALAVIILLTGSNVFFRFVLNNPIAWAEEIAIGLFIWLVFIGISSAMKRDSHVGVDYFVNKMPEPLRITCSIIRAAAIYFVLIYIFIFLGSELTAQATSKVTPVLGISYQFINIAVPLGGLLTAIQFTRVLVRSFKQKPGQEGGS